MYNTIYYYHNYLELRINAALFTRWPCKRYTREYKTLTHGWLNVELPSTTLLQHWDNIGSMSSACRTEYNRNIVFTFLGLRESLPLGSASPQHNLKVHRECNVTTNSFTSK